MSTIFDKFRHQEKPDAVTAPPVADIPVTPILETTPQELPKEADPADFIKSKLSVFAKLKGNKRALLGIFGGSMLVLAVVLQIAISSAEKTPSVAPTSNSGPEITGTDTVTTDWPVWEDPYNSYEMKIHPSWSTLDYATNVESTAVFALPDNVRLEITVGKTTANNIENYLAQLDSSRSVLWSGRASRVVNRSEAIRIGDYDGFDRAELISASGVEYLVSYIMVDNDVFTFALIPTGKNKSVANQELTRQLHLAMTTFKITNIADRLGEWKRYTSDKLPELTYPAYSISFPATWAINTKKSEGQETLTIARNGYKIIISQAAVGSAVCLFKDSPSFQGSSGDLRTRDFTEYNTDQGYVLRRYFKGNEGDNSIFLFCGKESNDTYFVTPLAIGGLNYAVPAKYDEGVIKEMDTIVKTLEPR